MLKFILSFIFVCALTNCIAQLDNLPSGKYRSEWDKIKKLPVNETNFRRTCDFIQSVGTTDEKFAADVIFDYARTLGLAGKREWLHNLLNVTAIVTESKYKMEDAQTMFRRVRENARFVPSKYGEALVCTQMMYCEWGKPDSSHKYFTLAKKFCPPARDWENLSMAYTFEAIMIQDMALVKAYFDKAISLAYRVQNKNALFLALANRTVKLNANNLPQQARDFYLLQELARHPSLTMKYKIYERSGIIARIPRFIVYNGLMDISLQLTDYKSAARFGDSLRTIMTEYGMSGVNGPRFNAYMSILYSNTGNYKLAKAFFEKSKTALKVPQDSVIDPRFFFAGALLYEHGKRFREALHYYTKAHKLVKTIEMGLTPIKFHYIDALIRTNNLSTAADLLGEINPLLKRHTYTAVGLGYYKEKAALLKARGDYGAYAVALDSSYQIKDSLANLNQYNAVQEIQTKMEVRDKEQQISRQKDQMLAQNRQIRLERIFYGILVFLSAAAIFQLVLLLRNRRIRAKQSEALHQSEMAQLEKQKALDSLGAVMEAEEKERRKVAEQLHDEVNAMLALASLNVSSVIEHSVGAEEPRLTKTRDAISTVSATIRNISHQLNPVMIERYGLRHAVHDMAETINLSRRLNLNVRITGFEDSSRLQPSFLNSIYRIVQELVQNVIKHASASEASIEIVEHPDVISLMIEDNGVGFDENTNDSKGIGLETIRRKVRFFNGEMEIVPRPEGGTMVVIELPVVGGAIVK